MAEAVFVAQVVSTLLMTGIIWFVQIVHYPLLSFVAGPGHKRFAEEHQRRTGWIVGMPMTIELLTAIAFLRDAWRVPAVPRWGAWLGLALAAAIWISTAFVQVPLHRKLLSNFEADTARRLVTTNWLRTLAWSLRAAMVVIWLLR